MNRVTLRAWMPEELRAWVEQFTEFRAGEQSLSAVVLPVDAREVQLVVETGDVGALNVPWSLDPFGVVMCQTVRLAPRREPYVLSTELARGLGHRGRTILAGRTPEVDAALSQSIFAEEPAAIESAAAECLNGACEALMARFAATAEERRLTGTPEFHWGVRTSPEHAKALAAGESEHLATRTPWSEIEPRQETWNWSALDAAVAAAKQAGRKICLGPLLDLTPGAAPDWALGAELEFAEAVRFVRRFISAVVQRYRGNVAAWTAAGGFGGGEGSHWLVGDQLRLAAAALESVRRIDEKSHVELQFANPWNEFALGDGLTLRHFADAVARTDVGLSGVELQFDMQWSRDFSPPLAPWDVVEAIVRWGFLQLPISASFRGPSPYPRPHDAGRAAAALWDAVSVVPTLRHVWWDVEPEFGADDVGTLTSVRE